MGHGIQNQKKSPRLEAGKCRRLEAIEFGSGNAECGIKK
jgi:hypothetical protein